MKKIQILLALLFIGVVSGPVWAQSESSPSLFSLTYLEFYGTPIQPVAYANLDADALGFNVLAEYNPSYYASLGLNYEKTSFYDGFNSTASFLGAEVRFFGAPNGKSPFAPYIYGGAGLGLNAGTGNELKAGIGSRLQLAYPFFLDFSAGSNWVDSGLQFLTFRGGLSVSFDLPKVESSPMAKPTKSLTVEMTPSTTITPVGTLVDLLATPSPTLTPTVITTDTVTVVATDTATVMMTDTNTMTMTPTLTETPTVSQSQVKLHYKAGMNAFSEHHYLTATTEFKKALSVDDPTVQTYFYAESNSMLGVIYQFYSKVDGHKELAAKYYERALKIDPMTPAAKKYLKMLQSGQKVSIAPESADVATGADAEKETAPTAVVKQVAAQPTTQPTTILQAQVSPVATVVTR